MMVFLRMFFCVLALVFSALDCIAEDLPLKPQICVEEMRRENPCGGECVVDIKTGGTSEVDRFIDAAKRPNVTLRLWPNVVLDFSHIQNFPVHIARCVTITSLDPSSLVSTVIRGRGSPIYLDWMFPLQQARSPRAKGPTIKYGPTRGGKTFLEIRCYDGGACNEHVRISGFQLLGPSLGQQDTAEVGIFVQNARDVVISNMEIAGWSEQGVKISRYSLEQTPERFNDVIVENSYIHHNQHPSDGGHAGGYGVATGEGGWATFRRNVFDFNRHAIESHGNAGGYVASENLVLKGGGVHETIFGATVYTTHSFDIHGNGSNGKGGDAGVRYYFQDNAFQYNDDSSIFVRGEPRVGVTISRNIFPQSRLIADVLKSAITLDTETKVAYQNGNQTSFDTYGTYGVCDFDGDGVDDLFLATGRTWWFSSTGKFPWSFLAGGRSDKLKDLRLAYIDGDLKCDVIGQNGPRWMISSGGTKDWAVLGSFGEPLGKVRFGRFDPSLPNSSPEAARQATHAFRRTSQNHWQITRLEALNWQVIQSSSIPFDQLQFGDFTGDNFTDVLANVGGILQISESGRGAWRPLNNGVSDDPSRFIVANFDAGDRIDDLVKVKFSSLGNPNVQNVVWRFAWSRLRNGTGSWQPLKSQDFSFVRNAELEPKLFVGNFGVSRGAAILSIDKERKGKFYGPTEVVTEWKSFFHY